MEYTSEEQVAPVMTGLGTRAPADIFTPNPLRSGHRLRAGAQRRLDARARRTPSELFAFDTLDLGAKWQVNGGLRVEHYETTFRRVDAAGLDDESRCLGRAS